MILNEILCPANVVTVAHESLDWVHCFSVSWADLIVRLSRSVFMDLSFQVASKSPQSLSLSFNATSWLKSDLLFGGFFLSMFHFDSKP